LEYLILQLAAPFWGNDLFSSNAYLAGGLN